MLAIILLSGVLVYIMYLTNGPIGMGFSFFLMMAAQPATETQFLTKKNLHWNKFSTTAYVPPLM
jgi:hypothetical protein